SGLLARSFARLRDVKPGFESAGVVMLRLALPEANYATVASVVSFHDRLLDAVQAVPGVRDAALTNWVPLTSDRSTTVVSIEDHPLPPNAVPRAHFVPSVDGQYFRTMHIPLLAGRTFAALDPARATLDVVVSHAFAERYWPGSSPLGKRVKPGITGPWWTV